MKREIATGIQDFESIRVNRRFYVDKTDFISKWWNGGDVATLITRPRRFGKTLNMSTLNCFFSNKFENRSDLFEGLKIWEDADMRGQQGKWPVIFLSFAGIKGRTCEDTIIQIKNMLVKLFSAFPELREYKGLDPNERRALERITEDMSDVHAALSLNLLSGLLQKIHGKKVLIFLDEYDTPLQEAYIHGYWEDLVAFTRTLFRNVYPASRTNSMLISNLTSIAMQIATTCRSEIFPLNQPINVVLVTPSRIPTSSWLSPFFFMTKKIASLMSSGSARFTSSHRIASRANCRFWATLSLLSGSASRACRV